MDRQDTKRYWDHHVVFDKCLMQDPPRLFEVAALAEGLFAREQVLVSNGLNSFTPLLRFTRDFSESTQELNEYRYFVIGAAKRGVARDPDFDAWFTRRRQEAQQRYQVTGDTSELELVSLKKRWWRQRAMGRRETLQMLRPYREEIASLWKIEVDTHATELSKEFEAKSKSRMAVYRAAMEQERGKTGLNMDRELSSSRAPVYSLPVGNDWKICFRLDHVLLAKPYAGGSVDVQTGEVDPGGIQFDLYLEIRRQAKSGSDSRRIAPISFESLFPIGSGLFGPRAYLLFNSLRELEALTRIYNKMFGLIRPELESTLRAVSARLGRADVGSDPE